MTYQLRFGHKHGVEKISSLYQEARVTHSLEIFALVSEQEKEEFLSYLDQNGILDRLTDVLIMLYAEQEPPTDPIEYVRKNMYSDNPDVEEIEDLKNQIQNATVELTKLQRTRDELRFQLEQFQHESQLDVEDCEEEPAAEDFVDVTAD